LYFFPRKIGTGAFKAVVDCGSVSVEARESDDGTSKGEEVETLPGEGRRERKKEEAKTEELEGVLYSARREVSTKEGN
jgi:hypothetical protein